jgi:cupin fold WbuC family metalloprotein
MHPNADAIGNFMRAITTAFLQDLMRQAAESPRKRAIFRLHEHEEPLQRMVNALLPGTYVTPHKHENPDKVELFSILVGRLACVQFSEQGDIQEVIVLDAEGDVRVVDIPPRVYHSIVALAPSAALEIIQGPYEAATHKKFAPFAPLEDSAEAAAYLQQLQTLLVTRGI